MNTTRREAAERFCHGTGLGLRGGDYYKAPYVDEAVIQAHIAGATEEAAIKDARIKALRVAITQACATPMIGKLALSILRGSVSLDDKASEMVIEELAKGKV